jgi:phosphatidylglycerophosphate synthase
MAEHCAGLVLAASADDGGVPAAVQVGGLSLPARAAILFARAGIATIHVSGPEAARRRIAADPRLRCIRVAGTPGPASGPLVACDAGSVFDAATLGRLLAAPGDGIVVVRDPTGRAVLARLPGERDTAALGDTLQEAGGNLDGLVSAAGRGHTCWGLHPGTGVALRAARPDEAAVAERRLVAAAGNVRDGRLDRLLNRRLSRRLTVLLARTRLEPNHVSVLTILMGLAGAALVACPGYVGPLAGVLVIQGASVLDCCDGELARLRLRESRAGYWLDIAGDTLTHAALFAAIGIVAWRQGLGSAWALALLLVIGVVPTFACVTYAEQTLELRARAGGVVNGVIDGLVAVLTTRDYLAVVLAFAVAGRLAWFLAGAAIGMHVFWPTLLVLLIVERRRRMVLAGLR